MAYANVIMIDRFGKDVQNAPIGFSWTVLFFSFFVPLFRGDWKWFVIMFLLAWITGNLSAIPLAFFYNKIYAKDLLRRGYDISVIEGGTESVNHYLYD